MNVAGRYFSWSAMAWCCLVVLGVAVAVGFFGFGVAPWFIVMGAFCLLMMGSMLWMVVGMGHHSGGHTHRSVEAPRHGSDGQESAIELLERRFAEGDLTEQDYRARRKVLVGGSSEREGR